MAGDSLTYAEAFEQGWRLHEREQAARSLRSRALAAEGVARWLERDAEELWRRSGADQGDIAAAWGKAGEAWYEASKTWSAWGGARGHQHAARCSSHAEDCSEMAADAYARWLTDTPDTPDTAAELEQLEDEYAWEADCAALRQAEQGGYERTWGFDA